MPSKLNSPPTISGMLWKVVINGKNSLSGAVYSATFRGDIPQASQGKDIYDAARAIAKIMRTANAEMKHVYSMKIVLQRPTPTKAKQ